MKKNFFVGVEFLGDEEIRISAKVKVRNKCQIYYDQILAFINKMTPLRKHISYVEARYDKSITTFFIFFRFLFNFSIITALGFLYLCIDHGINYARFDDHWKELCDSVYPCGFFYARFSSSSKLSYSVTMFTFSVVGYFICLYQWI